MNIYPERVVVGYVERLDLHDTGTSYLKLRTTRFIGVTTEWMDLQLPREMRYKVPFDQQLCVTIQHDEKGLWHLVRSSVNWNVEEDEEVA